jgi:histidinol-phosphate/aromatic aminotransferase/cobyric acid decarboxylase-like protein
MERIEPEWEPIAHRGEVALRVLTLRRAVAEGLGPLIHPEAAYLAEVLTDDGDAHYLGFKSLSDIGVYVRAMDPRIRIAVAEDESEAALQAALDELCPPHAGALH